MKHKINNFASNAICRFCITIWFFDGNEYDEALKNGVVPKPTTVEEEAYPQANPQGNPEPSLHLDRNGATPREPGLGDVRPMVITNEPFVDPGVEPILTDLSLEEKAPKPPTPPPVVPPPVPSLNATVEAMEDAYVINIPLGPGVKSTEINCTGKEITLSNPDYEEWSYR